MRTIYLDTETTGLDPRSDRLIEIGCVEYVARRPTYRDLHFYLNPEREIDLAATQIHGMTWEMLKDRPLFSDVASEVLEYLAGAELVAHSADFDVSFIDAELERIGRPERLSGLCGITDTVRLARVKYPGQRVSLDALCDRLGVRREHRERHGALLDAGLLAEVHVAMTAGQGGLNFDTLGRALPTRSSAFAKFAKQVADAPLIVQPPTPEEFAAHVNRMATIASKSGLPTVMDYPAS